MKKGVSFALLVIMVIFGLVLAGCNLNGDTTTPPSDELTHHWGDWSDYTVMRPATEFSTGEKTRTRICTGDDFHAPHMGVEAETIDKLPATNIDFSRYYESDGTTLKITTEDEALTALNTLRKQMATKGDSLALSLDTLLGEPDSEAIARFCDSGTMQHKYIDFTLPNSYFSGGMPSISGDIYILSHLYSYIRSYLEEGAVLATVGDLYLALANTADSDLKTELNNNGLMGMGGLSKDELRVNLTKLRTIVVNIIISKYVQFSSQDVDALNVYCDMRLQCFPRFVFLLNNIEQNVAGCSNIGDAVYDASKVVD
jgi:hypothetical protein